MPLFGGYFSFVQNAYSVFFSHTPDLENILGDKKKYTRDSTVFFEPPVLKILGGDEKKKEKK